MAATLSQLIYLHKASHSEDSTFDRWPALLCAQISQCLGIVSACIVYLRPFLGSLESGFLRVDDERRRGTSSHGYASSNGKASHGAPLSGGDSRRKLSSWNQSSTKSESPVALADSLELQARRTGGNHFNDSQIIQTREWIVNSEQVRIQSDEGC